MRFYISILILLLNLASYSQSNPGFLGKHHSIGAFLQFTPFYKDKRYLTPTIKVEQTVRSYFSIEGSFGFFSKTFTPEMEEDDLNFKVYDGSAKGQNYSISSIDGNATFKGFQSQIAMVFYLRKFGSMAPYGKRFSVGYFLNNSSIINDNLSYNVKTNALRGSAQTLTISPPNGSYTSKKISGAFLELAEKRVSGNNLFLQYSLQCTIPISNNYTAQKSEFNNSRDFLERKMKKSVIRNNLLCAFIGIGFLIK